jgi:ABC-type bacteriocin/lantibiotic exporter with double-glycine peptidase domain
MNHRADTSIPPPDHTIVNIHDDPAKKKETNKTWEQVKFWTRRIVVGKNYEEEQEEKKNHKWLNRVKKELRRHAAEFIGTFFLILFIAGIEVVQKYSNANSATGNGGVANLDKVSLFVSSNM